MLSCFCLALFDIWSCFGKLMLSIHWPSKKKNNALKRNRMLVEWLKIESSGGYSCKRVVISRPLFSAYLKFWTLPVVEE